MAGAADDTGYWWAFSKSLAAAGVVILVGTWVCHYLKFTIPRGNSA